MQRSKNLVSKLICTPMQIREVVCVPAVFHKQNPDSFPWAKNNITSKQNTTILRLFLHSQTILPRFSLKHVLIPSAPRLCFCIQRLNTCLIFLQFFLTTRHCSGESRVQATMTGRAQAVAPPKRELWSHSHSVRIFQTQELRKSVRVYWCALDRGKRK